MLNPEKARKLRPLRVVLAVLVVLALVLILDNLPTQKTVTTSAINPENNRGETEIWSAEPSSAISSPQSQGNSFAFCSFTGLLDLLENDLQTKLDSLGVPEEEYSNAEEYLSESELTELEAKATLAANLELTAVKVQKTDHQTLQKIFNFNDEYTTEYCSKSEPSEYKNLSELLQDYEIDLQTIDEYNESL